MSQQPRTDVTALGRAMSRSSANARDTPRPLSRANYFKHSTIQVRRGHGRTKNKSAGAFVHGSSNDRDTAFTQVSYQATSTPSNP